ncbi:hypothetical protein GCM10007063_17150 [Lentibacillus kapialis]|uniref:Uncharacterized protein n=1 Tax=Lentibacillus kapialis TaxID=340214 RepID=A0A917PWG6_9BACI|nr:hypothetical protein [Lentibacillus kapialis]GGJ95197.1 hypothetical protein GCM10007063_17150 [Lentibacillus kapialis]
MKELLPFIFFVITVVAAFLNLLGLMQLIPLYITLPLLFISIYLTIFTFTHRNVYRGGRIRG